jgi:hypothetical protein
VSDPRDSDAQVARIGEGSVREHVPLAIGHEWRDVRIRPIVVAFVILFGVAIFVHVLMYVVLDAFTTRAENRSAPASPLAVSHGRSAPPEPRLQIAPRADLARLRAREEALLEGYGWVDRDGGVARIPIERAIELLAARRAPPSGGARGTAEDIGAGAPWGAQP